VIFVTHAVKRPLLLFFLIVASAGPLAADQGVPRAAPSTQAPAPAPKASPLYKPAAPETPTIAEAEKADAAAKSEGATVTMSTTALLLIVVILIILIAA
jgi:hypothetical protein